LISQAFLHFPGIGPARLAQLQAAAICCWADAIDSPDRIPISLRKPLLDECHRCLAALEAGDVRYFVDQFAPQDKWRILAHFFEQITYFDIETEGLAYEAPITVIACWHRGRLQTFTEHENLDAFLDLLDDVTLLASFNGSSFDLPRILETFHIPALPCPHLDLRWICHHRGWKGGLKEITQRLGIRRPADLEHVEGDAAVRLWHLWLNARDQNSRELLLRYCSADTLLLVMLANRLTARDDRALDHLWSHLPPAVPDVVTRPTAHAAPPAAVTSGDSRLRALRLRHAG
jgi:uncharacterized protein YprB with RNaseH-like and TPR domain